MRRQTFFILAVAASVGLAPTAAGAQTSDVCAQFAWSVAREQAAFGGSKLPTLKSGDRYPGLLNGVAVMLEPQGGITYPEPPTRQPKSNPANGAILVAPPIAQAGLYQITLSEEAWIDIVQNGKRLRSVAFSGKSGCSGIRKSVRFTLAEGPLTIEISDAAKQTLNLDLLPAQ